MATTTNYSWTTPDDTDLVKDGASAIRSLGSAIDSTVFTNAGNAVQKSTIDAKGDLLVGTADNTIGRLAVGTNGYALVADSGETTGLKWQAFPSSTPTFTGCVVWGSGGQTISNVTGTTVTFTGSEQFDTNGFFDSATSNSRMTIPSGKGGYYYFFANLDFRSAGPTNAVELRKNGSTIVHRTYNSPSGEAGNRGLAFAGTVLSLVAGDYIEVRVYQDSGGNRTIEKDNDGDTSFGCYLIGV